MSQAIAQPIQNSLQINRCTKVTGDTLDLYFPGNVPYALILDGQQVLADPRDKGSSNNSNINPGCSCNSLYVASAATGMSVPCSARICRGHHRAAASWRAGLTRHSPPADMTERWLRWAARMLPTSYQSAAERGRISTIIPVCRIVSDKTG